MLCTNNTSLFAGSENCHGLHSPGNRYGCGIGYGNCTWYAAYRRPDLNFPTSGSHDAGTWISHARRLGFIIGDAPVSGAVAVINMGSVGHVAYVERRYQGPITVDYGVPFIAKEQDYYGSLPYGLGSNKVYTAIYAFSHNSYYRRQSSVNGFGDENEVYGFIYPTRTVKYADEYRLVLMRKDGAIPQTCNQVDQATMYMLNDKKELTVIKVGNKNWAQLFCLKSNDGGPLIDANLAEYLAMRRGGTQITDGIGGSYTPPTGNYTPNGNEATEHSQPGESDHPGYVHNVSMDDTEMSLVGSDDYHGSWTFYHGEVPTVNVRVRLKNKTNHKIGRNDVTIKWFESPNHTFNPQYDHHFATDHNRESIGPFQHNSHSDELVERKTGITHLQTLSPGVYYIYPVFYYNGEENMASEHDHNEYIKVTILPRYDVENVSLNTDKTTVTVGEGLTLSATVKNNYDSLPHDVRVGFYINGGSFNHKLFYAKVFTSADLGTQSFTVPALAPATPGSYIISMEVDDENKLAEKNENNNQRSFQLSVLDPLTISKMLPAKVKETIFWWLRTNRLTREEEERQRVEALKIPLKLKRQILWLLKQNRSN